MEEMEMLARAKMYMEKLANGINPITDEEVAENYAVNNVRLSRCFFYVSDILRQVIENGGVGTAEKPKKEKKELLQIPFEKRSSFAFSEKPIPASEIARRINDLGDSEKMQKLSYNGIVNWLSELGMLTWTTAMDGKKTKHPTPSGTEAGILIENRNGSKGPYQVVVYNLNAQHFIIDNLDAVIEAENMDAELKNKPWTLAHEECLIDLYKKGIPLSEIAITLKRNTSSVRSRLKKLGMIEKKSDA
jgi:hypothetical protein